MSKLWPTARTLRGCPWKFAAFCGGGCGFFLALQKRNAFPLRGRCRTHVRRMRWDAQHCFNLAAVQRTAGKHKGKTAFAAITPLHAKDATSSVGFRRQLPLEGKPNPTAKSTLPAATQSLPLEGKVPNTCEADEVGRTSLLQFHLGAPQCTAQRQSCLSLPCPHRKPEMPPHQSAFADSFPSRGSLTPRPKAPPPHQKSRRASLCQKRSPPADLRCLVL